MKIPCGSQSSANGIDSMENWLISKTTSNFWPYYVFLPMWFKIKEFQGTLLGSEFYLTLDITSTAIILAIWYVSLESPQGTAAWRTNTGEDTVNQEESHTFSSSSSYIYRSVHYLRDGCTKKSSKNCVLFPIYWSQCSADFGSFLGKSLKLI